MPDPQPFPQRAREPAKDLPLVHALRTVATRAASHRDTDLSWAELDRQVRRWLERLGLELDVGGGAPDSGTIDRTRLPGDTDSRAALLTDLHALEQDPTSERIDQVARQLADDLG